MKTDSHSVYFKNNFRPLVLALNRLRTQLMTIFKLFCEQHKNILYQANYYLADE